MSIRARLLAAIFLALLISLSLALGLAAWQAARVVHEELAASMANARQSTLATLGTLPAGPEGAAELRRIAAAFDGSRHMRVALLNAQGLPVAESAPAPVPPPPGWFLRLVSPPPATVTTQIAGVPGIGALRLQADPVSEAGERWAELRERVASFLLFFVVAAALCSFTVARSLRPLVALDHGLARVARGETRPEIAEAGPPETASLARAFNRMAQALAAAEAQNRRLSQQVMTIAEEERAEIARNLHDEIGPLLFAITTFAAAIRQLVAAGNLAPVPAQVQAIQDAAARVQHDVRDMLGRLHGGPPPAIALTEALPELLAFWRAMRPDIVFSLDTAHTIPLPEAVQDCIFRVFQEGISNAVRHGKPRHVALSLTREDAAITACIADDGAGPASPVAGVQGSGLGLPGMRARAAALGGSVSIVAGQGWKIMLRLPLPEPAA